MHMKTLFTAALLSFLALSAFAAPKWAEYADIPVPPEKWAYYQLVNPFDLDQAVQKQQVWIERDSGNLFFTRWTLPLVHPAAFVYPAYATLTNVLATPPKYRTVTNESVSVVAPADRPAVDKAMLDAAAASEAARQALKKGQLKAAETGLIDFLTSESIITTNDVKVAAPDLADAVSDWLALQGNTGDAKLLELLSRVREIEWLGGSVSDAYRHP